MADTLYDIQTPKEELQIDGGEYPILFVGRRHESDIIAPESVTTTLKESNKKAEIVSLNLPSAPRRLGLRHGSLDYHSVAIAGETKYDKLAIFANTHSGDWGFSRKVGETGQKLALGWLSLMSSRAQAAAEESSANNV